MIIFGSFLWPFTSQWSVQKVGIKNALLVQIYSEIYKTMALTKLALLETY